MLIAPLHAHVFIVLIMLSCTCSVHTSPALAQLTRAKGQPHEATALSLSQTGSTQKGSAQSSELLGTRSSAVSAHTLLLAALPKPLGNPAIGKCK